MEIKYFTSLFFLSVAVAILASSVALNLAYGGSQLKGHVQRGLFIGVALALGVAFLATFMRGDFAVIHDDNFLVTSGLSVSVMAITLLILGIVLMGSIGQRVMRSKAKRTEEILVSSEERFRLFVDAVKDYAIFMLNPQGLITTWNLGAERITGFQDGEMIGQHCHSLYPEADRPRANEETKLDLALKYGHYEGEAIHIKKNGSKFWANIVINPLYDQGGQLTGFSKIIRDITLIKESAARLQNLNDELELRVRERTLELEQREIELKAAKEAAEVANQTKSSFLANMSHEIRTPLGAVIGFSELMLSETMTTSEKQKNIEIIKRNGKLLSGIINDILDLSKVEAARLEIEKTDVAIVDLVNDVVSLLNLGAESKGIRIGISSSSPLPSQIKTDPMRLRQILFNIIGNAVKFTERGTVQVQVKISENDTSKLAILVKDSGRGISHDQRARLFSPFMQADATTTRRFGGTGLGLVLSKKLANALGGDVLLLDSAIGLGSTFQVTIDHGQSDARFFRSLDWNDRTMPVALTKDRPQSLSRLSILLVDDSLDNQELIKKLLQMAGAAVETANNGIEAIQKIDDGNYGVILMDLQMPEMDGYEATRRLRQQGFTPPIIALTAHAMKEERKKCLESGFSDHITKPIDRDLLIQTLAPFQNRYRNAIPDEI